jgi:hypothetical protein
VKKQGGRPPEAGKVEDSDYFASSGRSGATWWRRGRRTIMRRAAVLGWAVCNEVQTPTQVLKLSS